MVRHCNRSGQHWQSLLVTTPTAMRSAINDCIRTNLHILRLLDCLCLMKSLHTPQLAGQHEQHAHAMFALVQERCAALKGEAFQMGRQQAVNDTRQVHRIAAILAGNTAWQIHSSLALASVRSAALHVCMGPGHHC